MKYDIYIWEHNSCLRYNDLDGLVEEILRIPETYFCDNTIKLERRSGEKFFQINSELNKESLTENIKGLFLLKDIIE